MVVKDGFLFSFIEALSRIRLWVKADEEGWFMGPIERCQGGDTDRGAGVEVSVSGYSDIYCFGAHHLPH